MELASKFLWRRRATDLVEYPAYSYDYGDSYPGYGYSSYGYAPAYYGGYGYASPYYGRRFYAYGGPYIHRHWVHRRYHYWH